MARESVLISKNRTVHHLSILLSCVVVLETEDELADRGLPKSDLLAKYFSASQLVGGAVQWLGIQGLVVPSARSDTQNLIIFPENLGLNDTIEVTSPYEYATDALPGIFGET